MKYVPKKPPAAVTAALLSKDFSAVKGSYVIITETGAVRSMTATAFKEMYAAEQETLPKAVPAAPVTRSPRYPRYDPRSHVQTVAARMIGASVSDQKDSLDDLRRSNPTINVTARVSDAVRLGILQIENGVYQAAENFCPPVTRK